MQFLSSSLCDDQTWQRWFLLITMWPGNNVCVSLLQQLQGWTPLLVVTGVATTVGSSIPVGYNIGVMNTPAHVRPL
jgi:hypothetical protein